MCAIVKHAWWNHAPTLSTMQEKKLVMGLGSLVFVYDIVAIINEENLQEPVAMSRYMSVSREKMVTEIFNIQGKSKIWTCSVEK